MRNARKLLLFGAGGLGQQLARELDEDIVAFVDNDAAKQGTRLLGCPVIAPEQISEYSFDAIIISSMYESEIRRQLESLRQQKRIRSQVYKKEHAYLVPAVGSGHDCSPAKIWEDAHYAFATARKYLSALPQGRSSIIGKAVMEIGPGSNLGTALCLLAVGAKSVMMDQRGHLNENLRF